MGILSESLSADNWNFIDKEVDVLHPDRAMSYELVPDGLLVKMWTVDNINDKTYGPFAIKPENCSLVEHFVNRLNKAPCPLGESCPGQGLPQAGFSTEDWNAINKAVHQNEETSYAIVDDSLVVRQHTKESEAANITFGPFAIATRYLQKVNDFVSARNANQ